MESHNPTPMSPSEVKTPTRAVGPAAAPPQSCAVGCFWALGAGAAAALLSWLLIETTLNSFKPKGTATRFMTSTYMIPGAARAGHR